MPSPLTRIHCRLRSHDWKVEQLRITHGRVVCERCGASEWRHN